MKHEADTHEIIARTLCATTPWFLDARLQARDDGWAAFIRLNPTMAKVRAAEQSLTDSSLAAAAGNVQVQQMEDSYVAHANNVPSPGAQIVAYAAVFDTATASASASS
jgi:hypothetical protein